MEMERTTSSEANKRRLEEANRSRSEDSQSPRQHDSETARPCKRHNQGFPSGEEPSAAAAQITHIDNKEKPVKDGLVDLLFFPKIYERLESLPAAQENTCRWFLEKQQYAAWRDAAQKPEHGGFLWIVASPGSGKSTLMKFLFEQMRHSTKDDPSHIILSFFFVGRGTIEERSPNGLYRSLLYQLFEQATDLKESLEWMTDNDATGIHQNGWTEEALQRTLMEAVSKLGSRSLTIFVDARDECDMMQAAPMVSFFEKLYNHTKGKDFRLQVCFSTRDYPAIVIETGVRVVLEYQVGHMHDIQQYVKSKLKVRKEKIAETLRSEIVQKSSGNFLWVVLVMKILDEEGLKGSASIAALRRHLKTIPIPERLGCLFKNILARNAKDLQTLHLSLKLLLFASRPLKLEEFFFAVGLALNKEISTSWDRVHVSLEYIERFVSSSTEGLVEVTRNKPSEVQFIHQSIPEFLLSSEGQQWFGLSGNLEGYCHNMLKNCCLVHLNAPILKSVEIPDPLPQGPEGAKLREDLNLRFPFLSYSILNVLRHANGAQHCHIQQDGFLASFPLPRWVAFNNALEKHVVRRYTKSISLLYLLAENDLADLIKVHPRAMAACFEVGNERHGTPIFAALATNNNKAIKSFVKVFLYQAPLASPIRGLCEEYSRRLERVMTSRTFTFSHNRSVLSHVLERDDKGLLAFFIAARHANGQDLDVEAIVSYAADRGYRSVVTALLTLIVKKIDVKPKDTSEETPYSSWLAKDRRDVSGLLLDNSCAIESKDELGRSQLSDAAYHGREAAVRILLEHGAELESKDGCERTPLSLAAENGFEAIVQLLLDKGAEVDSKDKLAQTPLSRAASYGQDAIVRLLHKTGQAEVNVRDWLGCTPLSLAAQRGHATVVRTLLETANIDINGKDNLGFTPLLHTTISGRETAMRVLLEATNTEVNMRDRSGLTPLSWAAQEGLEAMVRILLKSARSYIEARDYNGRTPLSLAAHAGHEVIVLILLENGAELDSKDKWGHTPLSRVVRFKRWKSKWFTPDMQRNTWVSERESIMYEKDLKKRLDRAKEIYRAPPPREKEEIIKLLLDKGADVECMDQSGQRSGQRLLSFAAGEGHEDVVRILLATGRVQINAKDKGEQTALSWAVKNGHKAVAKLLIDAGAETTSL